MAIIPICCSGILKELQSIINTLWLNTLTCATKLLYYINFVHILVDRALEFTNMYNTFVAVSCSYFALINNTIDWQMALGLIKLCFTPEII